MHRIAAVLSQRNLMYIDSIFSGVSLNSRVTAVPTPRESRSTVTAVPILYAHSAREPPVCGWHRRRIPLTIPAVICNRSSIHFDSNGNLLSDSGDAHSSVELWNSDGGAHSCIQTSSTRMLGIIPETAKRRNTHFLSYQKWKRKEESILLIKAEFSSTFLCWWFKQVYLFYSRGSLL